MRGYVMAFKLALTNCTVNPARRRTFVSKSNTGYVRCNYHVHDSTYAPMPGKD